MKQITKNAEPRSLIQYRANRGTFDDMPSDIKDNLRSSLLDEQGHICCYCMKRIPQKLNSKEIEKNYPSCKIEHVKCQSKNHDQELAYKNILLACNGNHGSPKKMQTCDTYKGENDLSFNPANSAINIESLIKYAANGDIYSDDETINTELSEILNLNTKDLRDIRAILYKDIQDKIIREGKQRSGKEIQKHFYESEKERLLLRNDDKLTPFCMIGVYLVNKKLRKY
jgi:uncharacterized protein (TIGR02646 family)